MTRPALALWIGLSLAAAAAGGDGNRLTRLDGPCDPYCVGRHTARLVTPQWVGEEGVEAVIVLAIDDLREAEVHEAYLRPILERLKKIDGRAPVSLMTCKVDPADPIVARWVEEGAALEAHTADHPCPCLQGGEVAKARDTFDRAVDLVASVEGNRPCAFRMPCCDSMNSVSPRFFEEVFFRRTRAGRFLSVDSSVFLLLTADDPDLPRELIHEPDGQGRFRKYLPADRLMVNYVEDYPYPWVIGGRCWEIPPLMPSDWDAQHRNGKCSAKTVEDLKAAVDAVVLKQGVFSLCFHPHGWISNQQIIELIDHAVARHGRRVVFLTFREVADRLEKHVLGGHSLRASDGGDGGVRVLDVDGDGYMDAVIGTGDVLQTRIWSPEKGHWIIGDFPTRLCVPSSEGVMARETGVRFGVLQRSGAASALQCTLGAAGLWHFEGGKWRDASRELEGLLRSDAAPTSLLGVDQGARLVDLDLDGICELIVGNPRHRAVFRFLSQEGRWVRLSWALPNGATVVDAQGRDAGLRLVDVNEDGHLDVVFSNPERYSLHLFVDMQEGWSRVIHDARRPQGDAVPPIVRADGSNNGAWFHHRHMVVQNEDTGGKLPQHVEQRFYTQLLVGDIEPPPRSPERSLRAMLPRPGFRVDLVAAEPLVMDPIDIAWGPDGKAWVVEMTDYPLGLDDRGQPGGRVRFLEDLDGDGRYDRSTVFLEGLSFPTGVMPWRKGVIVTLAPEVFYAEDTSGDGRADVRRTLFTGFNEGNQQHRVNHPRWRLDNWVSLANGDSGGSIRSARTGQSVNISGRDLRVRPDEGLLDPQSGQTQYGRNRNDWGDWFGCNNSNPGWFYAVEDHYLRRNPFVAGPPARVDLTRARHAYPSGRVITHCFIPQPTPPEGQPSAWTCICSLVAYRDDLFGPAFGDSLFAADAVYNCVHRMVLVPDGVLFRGERAPDEQKSEFLCSADPWFRPCTIRTGPDGALWVVDMYRFVIEHPEWIDPALVKKLDLRAGHDRGRVYRIYPVGAKPRPVPRLDRLDTAGLVAALDSPSGWQRDMVQQLLVWRGDKSAGPHLEKTAAECPRALARLHAVCTLDGLGLLRAEVVEKALADDHPGVRRHAARLSEPFLNDHKGLVEVLARLATDRDPQVRRQVAYSLGACGGAEAGRALARIALAGAEDEYLLAAAMSSVVPHADALLAELESVGAASSARTALVGRLKKLKADIAKEPELVARPDSQDPGALVQPVEVSRDRVEKLLGRRATVDQIQKVMGKYRPALKKFGDPERGKRLFVEATCATCHQFKGQGERIGPDLETLVDRSPEALFVAVIDPNRAAIDRYVEHVALTLDGLQHEGMLLEETSNSITLVNTEGKKRTILRKDLEELVFTGRSHMPEGLEAKMDLQGMADLFAYVGGAGGPPKQVAGNRPEVVRRADDLAFHLAAEKAEIYGPEITFEPKYGNIGWWNSSRAHVAWQLRNERVGEFDVWLDFACEDKSAGSTLRLEIGPSKVTFKVPGTGTWDDYRREKIGRIKLKPGDHRLIVRPEELSHGALIDLREVTLVPVGEGK